MKSSASLLAALLYMFSPFGVAAEVDGRAVDQLFAKWDKADSPGASVLIIRDGKIVYRKSFGMANIEAGMQNTPSTVFTVGSVAKQFTAFAVYLLAQDGKLSLDDDVRKYVPQLMVPDTITIEQLLHHTSGLRDYYTLYTLAGLREDDRITSDEISRLLWLQRTLNFAPGTEQLYSNSGYFLLGRIVQKVSGLSLAEFAKQRIFGPLKMDQTQFVDDYGTVIKGRAIGYVPFKDSYHDYATSTSVVGPAGLFTTIDDLALWDANFDDARVGGRALMKAWQTPAVLKSGKQTDYAGGLVVGTYRQLRMVAHNGAETAYRAGSMRFPDQHLSIYILSNAANLSAPVISRRIANLYLTDAPGLGAVGEDRKEAKLDVPNDAPFLGDFQMRPNLILTFTAESGKLMVQGTGQPKFEMFASGPDTFFTKAFDAEVTFDIAMKPVVAATWTQGGQKLALSRVAETKVSDAAMQACTGDFYSEDLRTVYRIFIQGGILNVGYWRAEIPLTSVRDDLYVAPVSNMWINFHRDLNGQCDSAVVQTGRASGMQFVRVHLPNSRSH